MKEWIEVKRKNELKLKSFAFEDLGKNGGFCPEINKRSRQLDRWRNDLHHSKKQGLSSQCASTLMQEFPTQGSMSIANESKKLEMTDDNV